ncbi:hypothetical protein RhiirA4_483716 [Rhizophagus irregularis]|uniref:Uncharacterized protein n=1 Tax=Rhizophagus irregularis TaxID=588596 RepID=A0A2I1HMY5_9GLOM|nr:hypothetical protein RhiirA4_483716 [Rhizophagus irregularis]
MTWAMVGYRTCGILATVSSDFFRHGRIWWDEKQMQEAIKKSIKIEGKDKAWIIHGGQVSTASSSDLFEHIGFLDLNGGEMNAYGNANQNSEIYFQIKECDKIRKEKFKNRPNEDKSKSFQTHPQAFYITSRLLNFKKLPKPVNSSDLSSFQFSSDTNYTAQSTSANPISECLDCLIK